MTVGGHTVLCNSSPLFFKAVRSDSAQIDALQTALETFPFLFGTTLTIQLITHYLKLGCK